MHPKTELPDIDVFSNPPKKLFVICHSASGPSVTIVLPPPEAVVLADEIWINLLIIPLPEIFWMFIS